MISSEYLSRDGTLRGPGGAIKIILGRPWWRSIQEKRLNVNRAEARGELEALDAPADVRFVYLSADPSQSGIRNSPLEQNGNRKDDMRRDCRDKADEKDEEVKETRDLED